MVLIRCSDSLLLLSARLCRWGSARSENARRVPLQLRKTLNAVQLQKEWCHSSFFRNLPPDAHSQILAATPSRAEIAFIVRVSERRRTRKGLDLQAAGEKKKIRSDWKSSAGLIFREHCLWAWGNKNAKTTNICSWCTRQAPGHKGRSFNLDRIYTEDVTLWFTKSMSDGWRHNVEGENHSRSWCYRKIISINKAV